MRTNGVWAGLILSTIVLSAGIVSLAHAQALTMEQIRTNLLNNPPNSQNQALRKQTILALDQILQDDASRTSASVQDFYNYMMEKVRTEIRDTVKEGALVWMMYNDGYIVKTPDCVFAFDLIDGCSLWLTKLAPDLIDRIKVLFVTHSHGDHFSGSIVNRVKANGGYVVVPSENYSIGNVSLAPSDAVTLSGLNVRAYYGLHNVPLRMYEVTCPNGLKFFHTGDEQTTMYLPYIERLDLLMLDAWINESGSSSAVVGMSKSLDKLKPMIMIPGHIQELNHDGPIHSAIYAWPLAVADASISTDVRVMAWGERLAVTRSGVTNVDNKLIPSGFTLSQNYPNPFNPATTIEYQLPKQSFVKLKIFDLLGREMATLVNDKQDAGKHAVRFDALSLTSGVYFYKLEADDFTQTRKLLLLK